MNILRFVQFMFLGAFILMSVIGDYYLKNPKDYPPENIRNKINEGELTQIEYFKYIGLFEYKTQELIYSKSNWENGFKQISKGIYKIGNYGFVLQFILMIIESILLIIVTTNGKFSVFVYDYIAIINSVIIGICIMIRFKIIAKEIDNSMT